MWTGRPVVALGMAVVITGNAGWGQGRVRGDFGILMRWASVRVAKEGGEAERQGE